MSDKLADAFGCIQHSLAVGNLRFACSGFHLEFPKEAITNYVQMQFAHASNDRLPRLLIGRQCKSRVFLSQTLQTDTHLFLVGFGRRFNGHGYHGLRERGRFESNIKISIRQGVSRHNVLDPNEGANVTGISHFYVLASIGLHDHEPGYTLCFSSAGVVKRSSFFQGALVKTEKDQFSNVWVGHQLESQPSYLCGIVRLYGCFHSIGILPFHRRKIQRVGKVVDNCIHEHLNTFVLECTPWNHADKLKGKGSFSNGKFKLILRNVLSPEVFLGNIIIKIGNCLDK